MLSLHTNAAALSSQNAVGNTQKSLTTSLTRLGTGYRVNSAMDDAAGLQIATRLDAQTRGMSVAQRNTQNGISMMQTAEGAFSEMTNVLLRMKDLATEAYNASSTTDDVAALQAEFDALGLELSNIFRTTSFGGQRLFSDGTNTDGTGGFVVRGDHVPDRRQCRRNDGSRHGNQPRRPGHCARRRECQLCRLRHSGGRHGIDG